MVSTVDVVFSKQMAPRPQLRRAIKHASAAVCVLLLIIWIVSGWWTPDVPLLSPKARWSLSHGCLVMSTNTGLYPWRSDLPWGDDVIAKFTVGETVQYRILWLPSRANAMKCDFLAIPLWSLIPLAAIPVWWIRYTDQRALRRTQQGRCPSCNYNRTGLPQGAICPECGKLPT